ncbi:hypothetical protein F8388_005318 [Cannabis sativa]|uniref:Uncharacterized protein n=1 Tax=Cannabis sativa TaxID=3483 RepID=A0A7J6ENA3_CANSA|nr:hypothetical protein F8388_005318 [Cannabis sativa]KAF4374920.1 hypothetical protein G4B88_004671 [Cannabis sativa]
MNELKSSLASNSTSQLNILRHDRNSLSVDSTEISVFKKTDQVSFGSFLKSRHSTGLESKIGLEILSDFSNQSLEWKLADQKLGAFLATVPGLNLCGFFTPPVAGADFLAALVASCFLGAFPPVDFLAVCLVRAIVEMKLREKKRCLFLGKIGSENDNPIHNWIQTQFYKQDKIQQILSSLASDSTSQLNILRHDRNSLSVDRTEISVFEETDQVSFGSFLKSRHSAGLESKIGLEILSDFSHQSLEWKLADQKLGALLATVPGLNLCGFFTPPVAGADFLAALVASCFLGAFPPVDFLAVCLVRAIEEMKLREKKSCLFLGKIDSENGFGVKYGI